MEVLKSVFFPWFSCSGNLKYHLYLSAQPLTALNLIRQLQPAGGRDPQLSHTLDSHAIWEPIMQALSQIHNRPNSAIIDLISGHIIKIPSKHLWLEALNCTALNLG